MYEVRTDTIDIPSKTLKSINDFLTQAMIVAGYDKKTAQDLIWKHVKNVEHVVRMSLDLNKTMGEKYTSADLEVVVFRAEDKFSPGIMEDANESPGSKKEKGGEEKILCVLTLGMGMKEGRPKKKNTLLLKPQVVLQTTSIPTGRTPVGKFCELNPCIGS